MEYGFWRPDELHRLLQSLAASCETFASVACRGSSRSETTAYIRGFLTALSSSAQAFGIGPGQGTGTDPAPEAPKSGRSRKPSPPPQWYAEDLGSILQALASAADDLVRAAEGPGEERRARAFVNGFQAALRSVAHGLSIPPPRSRARRDGPTGGLGKALRQLLPSSPIGMLPWQHVDDGQAR